MRPEKLTISAFGPYADKTEIDFSESAFVGSFFLSEVKQCDLINI